MKKTLFIKKLGLGLAATAAVVPLAISATACSDTKAVTVRYISYDTLREKQSLGECAKGHFNKDKLLLGSKKFFNGNYILFIGSNAYDTEVVEHQVKYSTTQQFFAGSDDSRKVSNWFGSLYNDSIWGQEMTRTNSIVTNIDVDFGFVTFIDDFDFTFHDDNGHEFFVADRSSGSINLISNIGPFDIWKKTDGLLTQTREYNKMHFSDEGYEWDEDKEISEDDYIRQDDQAKAYRALINRAAALFPTNDKRKKAFDNGVNNKTGLMAVYKNGRLVDLADIPTKLSPDDKTYKNTDTLFGTINKYYTKEDEEK